MKYFYVILIACTISILSSCDKQLCENPGLALYFGAFDSSDLTCIAVKRYEKNTNFSKQPVSTRFYSATVTGRKDTVTINKSEGYYILAPDLTADYDYQIEIVVTGRVHRITELNYKEKLANRTRHGCVSGATWKLDGQFYDVEQYFLHLNTYSSNAIYIMK